MTTGSIFSVAGNIGSSKQCFGRFPLQQQGEVLHRDEGLRDE